jgi:hypothetical protein
MAENKIEDTTTTKDEIDLHREIHQDPEKLPVQETPPKRRQPFGAVWTVFACGFALMSDGSPPHPSADGTQAT